jgi:hypothetical protein
VTLDVQASEQTVDIAWRKSAKHLLTHFSWRGRVCNCSVSTDSELEKAKTRLATWNMSALPDKFPLTKLVHPQRRLRLTPFSRVADPDANRDGPSWQSGSRTTAAQKSVSWHGRCRQTPSDNYCYTADESRRVCYIEVGTAGGFEVVLVREDGVVSSFSTISSTSHIGRIERSILSFAEPVSDEISTNGDQTLDIAQGPMTLRVVK